MPVVVVVVLVVLVVQAVKVLKLLQHITMGLDNFVLVVEEVAVPLPTTKAVQTFLILPMRIVLAVHQLL